MTNAKIGTKSSFAIGDGGDPEAFTTIAEVQRFSGPAQTVAEQEATSLDSDAKEYIAGLADGQPVDIEFIRAAGNTEQNLLRDSVGTTINVLVTWPGIETAAFALVLLGYDRGETTAEGVQMGKVNGRISGAITWTDI